MGIRMLSNDVLKIIRENKITTKPAPKLILAREITMNARLLRCVEPVITSATVGTQEQAYQVLHMGEWVPGVLGSIVTNVRDEYGRPVELSVWGLNYRDAAERVYGAFLAWCEGLVSLNLAGVSAPEPVYARCADCGKDLKRPLDEVGADAVCLVCAGTYATHGAGCACLTREIEEAHAEGWLLTRAELGQRLLNPCFTKPYQQDHKPAESQPIEGNKIMPESSPDNENARPRCHYGRPEPRRGDHGTEVPAVARVRLVWAHRDGSGVQQYDADMCEACLKDKCTEFGDPEDVAAGSVEVLTRYA